MLETESERDRQIRRLIEDKIRMAGHPSLNFISVSASRGRVRLVGKVPSYYSKQLAQTAAMAVSGVTSIQNDLLVH
jgi:osmotically-inducible protein OsmY